MTEQQFQGVLREIRDDILSGMRAQGFPYPPSGKLRYDPTPFDVNHGFCDFFARLVVEAVPEADWLWIDIEDPKQPDQKEPREMEYPHAFVLWRGKYYDAECISGVKDWRKLPLIKNREKSRSAGIREWKKSGRKDCT